MTEDRVDGIVDIVRKLLGEPTGPNIGGVIDLLKPEMTP
jgi:hypothetical protein